MGMHTISHTVEKVFNEKIIVDKDIVDEMYEINKSNNTSDKDILCTIPQNYKIGTQVVLDPEGMNAEKIEGTFLNIVAKSAIKDDIVNCFRTANINVAELPISVLSLAEAMLPEREKTSGCVLVDMGAETTSVAIYKSNILRHLAVIPLGSANINRDLCSLQIEDKEAEELKLTYGSAFSDYLEANQDPIKLTDGRTVKYEEICGLIEARIEEIFLNIDYQIKSQDFSEKKLIGGIFLTGGGMKIKDVEKAVKEHLHFEKSKVLNKTQLNVRGANNEFNKDGSYNTVLAIIDKADINCCGGDLGANSLDIFEEEARRKAEEEAAAVAAAAAAAEEAAAAAAAEAAAAEEARKEAERRAKKNRIKNLWTKFIDTIKAWVTEEDHMN
jgi:cell division protein FtsA